MVHVIVDWPQLWTISHSGTSLKEESLSEQREHHSRETEFVKVWTNSRSSYLAATHALPLIFIGQRKSHGQASLQLGGEVDIDQSNVIFHTFLLQPLSILSYSRFWSSKVKLSLSCFLLISVWLLISFVKFSTKHVLLSQRKHTL